MTEKRRDFFECYPFVQTGLQNRSSPRVLRQLLISWHSLEDTVIISSSHKSTITHDLHQQHNGTRESNISGTSKEKCSYVNYKSTPKALVWIGKMLQSTQPGFTKAVLLRFARDMIRLYSLNRLEDFVLYCRTDYMS